MQLLLGNWLLRTGDRAGARVAYSAAIASDPKFEAAYLMLAQLDISERKLDPARQALQAVLNSNNRSASGWLMLGLLEDKAGNPELALGHYRKVLDVDPTNVMAMNNLAYWLATHGQPDEALKLAQQAKESAPDDPTVEDTLGWRSIRKVSTRAQWCTSRRRSQKLSAIQ